MTRRLLVHVVLVHTLLVSLSPRPGAAQPRCDFTDRVSAVVSWRSDLSAGETACVEVGLEAGAFVRMHVTVDSGLVDLRLFEPGRPRESRSLALGGGLGYDHPLVWEAAVDGDHVLAFTGVRLETGPTAASGLRATVLELESPALRSARRAALGSDPRVAWLRDVAVPIRTIEPSDDGGFDDLDRLRPLLQGVRVVHLGANYFDSGADFLALGRIARFLVEEMGFEAIVFESGIYDMWRTERALRADRDPAAAFGLGLFGFLAESVQLAPLATYVAERMRQDPTFAVAGFDYQFSSDSSAGTFAGDARRVLTEAGAVSPLATAGSAESRLLDRWLSFLRDFQAPPLARAELERLGNALAAAAADLDGSPTPSAGPWTKILRSTAEFVTGWPDGREAQMADNLLWLVEERFANRRVVVFGMSHHMMGSRHLLTRDGWAGPWPFTAGGRLAERLGDEVYRIGATSYEGSVRAASPYGRREDLQPDLHPLQEFEELMAETGLELALVDLRGPSEEGAWIGGTFVARVLNQTPILSRWSDHLDALLFLREQRPSERAPPPRGDRSNVP